jgi:hypothetical protein
MQGETSSRGIVNGKSVVLVRGRWANDDYGAKERKAVQLIRNGQEIAIVSDFEFLKLLEGGRPAKVMDRVVGQPIEWLNFLSESRFKRAAKVSGPLDYENSALGRIEQGFLRHSLFGSLDEVVCALCGRTLPTSLVVAAHINTYRATNGIYRTSAIIELNQNTIPQFFNGHYLRGVGVTGLDSRRTTRPLPFAIRRSKTFTRGI